MDSMSDFGEKEGLYKTLQRNEGATKQQKWPPHLLHSGRREAPNAISLLPYRFPVPVPSRILSL